MKQVLKYFVVLLLMFFGVGCSNDDANAELKELIIKVDKSTINEGESIFFSARDVNDKVINEVDYYVNNIKVSNPYKFNTVGTFNVTAKKNGYKNSKAIDILVNRVIKKLTLIASGTEVAIGEDVLFNVTAEGSVISDFSIKYVGNGLFSGNTWYANKIGTHQFYAVKEGFYDSEIISINVKPKEDQRFIIDEKEYSIDDVYLEVYTAYDINSGKRVPYIYTDEVTNRTYQKYRLYAKNSSAPLLQSEFIVELRVYVASTETNFVVPNQENIKYTKVSFVYFFTQTKSRAYALKDLETVNFKWISPFEHSYVKPGTISYQITTKDKKVEINYQGEYNGLRFRDDYEIVPQSK
ncbi:hypothetical protein SAMN04488018_101168 [Myroides marinus]|uniref:Uncharacterized protein n=1 Tax=Myroides marinus TaxID=703342 RepID=A0A1H6R141_9FLAO|nr:hypothetical protein [Myroides marinus]SEI49493.1 hypothetical protein SAMN04488018_101168 [Myroides marinus]